MNIQVQRVKCFHCDSEFHQFTGFEFNECPICGEDSPVYGIREKKSVDVILDFKTGEVRAEYE